jgi:hypothetical protein
MRPGQTMGMIRESNCLMGAVLRSLAQGALFDIWPDQG